MGKAFGWTYVACWLILIMTDAGDGFIRDLAGVILMFLHIAIVGLLLNLFAHKSVKGFKDD